MSVYFNQETMQFYLHTKHTSYVMELYENHLAHSYWGSRVNEIPNLIPQISCRRNFPPTAPVICAPLLCR